MKTTYASALVLALSALTAGHAMADEANAPAAGKTREQVRAELMEYQAAQRGDFKLPYAGGMTYKEFMKDMDAFKNQGQPDVSSNKPVVVKTTAQQG